MALLCSFYDIIAIVIIIIIIIIIFYVKFVTPNTKILHLHQDYKR
jgi:hypothetical protein